MEISGIPSGNLLQFAIENGPWVRWFTYQTWGFSIATLVYQRVYHLYHPGNIVYLLTMVKSIHLYRKKIRFYLLGIRKSPWSIFPKPVIFCYGYLVAGGIPTPLKNHGLRQLGVWNSQLNGKSIQIPWFQSPPTSVCWFINHSNPHSYIYHKT